MAKGNPLMSQMRGKVGDLVMTRLAGEQITRSRNRHPKNPQTIKQMAQRAALATCVEFYTRGTRNLFKFAFENKKPGESDYNAFVRANIANVPVQSHKTLLTDGFVFGNFVMSLGSLPSLIMATANDGQYVGLNVGNYEIAEDDPAIGPLSAAISEKYGLADGDIITLVGIGSAGLDFASSIDVAKAMGSLTDGPSNTRWSIVQFTLDSTSTATFSSLGFFGNLVKAGNGNILSVTFPDLAMEGPFRSQSLMVGAIASRVTSAGVKVSSSTLLCSPVLSNVMDIGTSDNWKEYVAKNWKSDSSLDVTPENILQGSISKN